MFRGNKKNMWDLMKKRYAAWNKLLTQMGIGYNKHTHYVNMESKRREEYMKVMYHFSFETLFRKSCKLICHLLQANPDAKIFRTKPLSFPQTLFKIYNGHIIGRRGHGSKCIAAALLAMAVMVQNT